MIAFLLLLSLLASNINSRDDVKELQSMYDIYSVISSHRMGQSDLATELWYNKRSLNLLQPSQKEVIWSQIACEADPEEHTYWKKDIQNHSQMVEWLAQKIHHDNINCNKVNSTNLPSHQCLCDNSSNIYFCYILEAEFQTAEYRRDMAIRNGDQVPCADDLWNEIRAITNRTIFFERQIERQQIDYMAKDFSDYSNNKVDMSDYVKRKHELNSAHFSGLCLFTPQIHRILSKLRRADIRFRIYDDLLKMKFLSMVPFNFCSRDYSLSKCICDERSSASFCVMFFLKQGVLLFLNETMCDDYPGNNSAAPTSFSYPIIASLLLYSQRF